MKAETIDLMKLKHPPQIEHFVGEDGQRIVAIVSRNENGEIILEYPLQTEHFVRKDGRHIVADVFRDENRKIIYVRPGSPKYVPPQQP